MDIVAMNLHYRWFRFQKFLDDVSSLGLTKIELWGGSPHFNSDDATYREVRELRKTLDLHNLSLVCLTPEQCMYPINIASEDQAMRNRSIRYFEKNIDIAGDLDCDLMLITPGTGYFFETNHSDDWQRSLDSLRGLMEYATKAQIRLGLEVLRADESSLVNNVSSLKEMVEAVDQDGFGGILDTIPMAINGEKPADYLDALGDKLFHIHFIDGTPYNHLAWGDGNLDLKEYLQQLNNFGYTGDLSLEITDRRYFANPSGALEKSVKEIRAHFNK